MTGIQISDSEFVRGFDQMSAEAYRRGGIIARSNIHAGASILSGQNIVLGLMSNGRIEPMMQGKTSSTIPSGNLTVGFFVVPLIGG